MKFKIDGKYCEVSFWSFLKGYFLSWMFVVLSLTLIFFLIGVFVA